MVKTGGTAGVDEPFGHEVRHPRPRTLGIGSEDEPVLVFAAGDALVVSAKKGEARLVESDPPRATGLGGNEHTSVRAFDDRSLNREGAHDEVDVDPPHCKQLTSTSAGHRSKYEIEVQRRVRFCDRLEQPGDFNGSRWSHLGLHALRWAGALRHVLKDPRPSLSLGEGSMQRRVHPPDGSDGERLAVGAAFHPELLVEVVDHRRRPGSYEHVAGAGLQMPVGDRAKVPNRRRRPASASPREPLIKQLPHRRPGSYRRSDVGVGRELTELALGFCAGATDCAGDPAASRGVGVGCRRTPINSKDPVPR
jgi:hypothetical protein